jgi:putative endonuclease
MSPSAPRRHKQSRQKAWRFGRFAETLAAWHLRFRGYRVIQRGFRAAVGEIDIVARRGGLVVFVEVKARKDRAAAVTPGQTARIVRAAQAFLQAHPHFSNFDQRFDVILVSPWRLPVHLVDAWRPEL